ncbi:MAG TPA: metallophosphoesterase [Thermoanaerobaculia bacterium]
MKAAALSLVVLAILLGNARLFLFALNRIAFRQRTHHDRMKWALAGIPPVLLALSTLYFFFYRAVENGTFDLASKLGAGWTLLTAGAGVYWVVDRAWQNAKQNEVSGVRSLEPEVVAMRRAHIPFAFLRKLGAHNDVYDLEVTVHEVAIDDLPMAFDGYKIAFLSDTHVAPFMRRDLYREIVAQIRKRETDLVLLGGDYVTWKRHIPLMAELLIGDMQPPDGIYGVLGNHDYWAGAQAVIDALRSRDVRFLVNQSVELARGDAVIDLVGIDEVYRGDPDLEKAFTNVPGDRPCLGVSHHPDIIDWIGNHRFDLLVCGHTHGGQIRVPYFGALVVPSRHESKYAAGFFRERNTLMYVGRGIGAVPPIRILCKPELPLFILRRNAHETVDRLA